MPEASDSLTPLATRAEELRDHVLDYFAVPRFYTRMFANKAAALVGGRGTGKTMILKSMAIDYKSCGGKFDESWRNEGFVGAYVRIDTNVVAGFEKRGIEDEMWRVLFGHYFNLRIALEMIQALQVVEARGGGPFDFGPLYTRLCQLLRLTTAVGSLREARLLVRASLDALLAHVNNPTRVASPLLVTNGVLITELSRVLAEDCGWPDKIWYLLIDEFENLSEDQQRVVNTLIKENQYPCVYKIAFRPEGWWTRETLRPTEILTEPADFDRIDVENDLDADEYKRLVVDVFKMRLERLHIPLTLQELLPTVSPSDEARSIVADGPERAALCERVRTKIGQHPPGRTVAADLALVDDPLSTRVHLILLEKGISGQEIAAERRNGSDRYKDWLHHYQIGSLFLLCSEYRKKKVYAGFVVFIILSSKILRNFIWLFNRTLEYAQENGFTVDAARPFSASEQSTAARDVADGAVAEILSFGRAGSNLYGLTNRLGRLFEQLGKDPRQSQPEVTHFEVVGDLREPLATVLRAASLYSVLQVVGATKQRGVLDLRGREYVLNRTFSPHYRISYRKMHKLSVPADEMLALATGSKAEQDAVMNRFVARRIPVVVPEGPQQRPIWAHKDGPDA